MITLFHHTYLLQAKTESNELKLSERTNEINRLRSSISDLNATLSELNEENTRQCRALELNFEKQLNDVKSEKQSLASEKEDMQREHEEALSRIQTLSSTTTHQHEDKNDLDHQVTTDAETLQVDDVERLTSMLTKTTIEIEELNITVESLTKERDSLLYEKEEMLLSTDYQQQQKLHQQTLENNSCSNTSRNTSEDELLSLQKRIEKLTAEKNSIDEKYQLLTEQVRHLYYLCVSNTLLYQRSLGCTLSRQFCRWVSSEG